MMKWSGNGIKPRGFQCLVRVTADVDADADDVVRSSVAGGEQKKRGTMRCCTRGRVEGCLRSDLACFASVESACGAARSYCIVATGLHGCCVACLLAEAQSYIGAIQTT